MSFLDFKHLVLVDLNSNGLFFYLAKDVRNLPALDFANLVSLARVPSEKICQGNLLADDELALRLIEKNLRDFELKEYKLVFLVAPEFSLLEKALLLKNFPFWQKVEVVERHFFYNFYLMQKRNFSKVKFLTSLFADCAELSLFEQDKLVAAEQITTYNLAAFSKHFLDKNLAKKQLQRPECFYFFTHNLSAKTSVAALAKYLKMEAIAVEQLC
jgi:hypothetical protein